ncbi:rod shape determining protein RodA [Marinactinospora thermotolerans DSM 45154]|uniref:peptidoglycan glycosyltransferase n=1 Tax=Marinactinospora thermotolerans DSM 45154 TaxID=1122192 RepID=A0A1T4SP54_9ACTN|nr:rod shape-determining protein RodA [Marinactinospora thermotolerans]SKA29953.1 rod shape determining protein RodA [Marinactinospora thermotolerans DSM 45154]
MSLYVNSQRSWSTRAGRLLAARPRRIDWPLLSCVLVLCAVGALLVWASTASDGDPLESTQYLRRYLVHVAIGLVACLLVASVDYRVPRAYAPIVYLVGVVGLALVLTPLGEVINGSRSWIVIGGMQAQPGEVAKIGLILGVAMLLGEPRDGEHAPMTRDVLFSLVALAVPLGLILAQPDLGTAMVLCSIYLGMLTLSGAPIRWVIGLICCGVVGALSVWWFGLLQDYQLARFATFVDPTADPRGAGYNANQALIAIGSGGFIGTGLFDGEQTRGNFVPEQHTDFIFTVAGEQLGFLGSSLIIGLFAFIIWRTLQIARECDHPYGRLVCVGVAVWMTFQCFINIGMTLGIMPITGLPLPFVSYGGTAAVANLTAVGLVLGIYARDRGFG